MINIGRSLKSAAFAIGICLLSTGALRAADDASSDDKAKILAGLAPAAGSPLAPLTQDEGWKRHAQYFNTAWKQLEDRQLTKIRAWSTQNLKDPQPVLFYMFSGPDYLYANTFFPNASTYVMSGLEPVGQVPDLSKLSRATFGEEIRQLEASLNSVMSYSFFITNRMREQLNVGKVTGTLPILYVFLARSGKTIDSTTLVTLDTAGVVHPAIEPIPENNVKGVRINFSDPEGRQHTLYYFSTDVSNSGLKSSGFLNFCAGLGTGDAFVKSASYLMHSDNFSTIRGFLLTHSAAVLQDDSGIPLRFFAPEWQLNTFGKYVGPIALFAGRYQDKLAAVFRKNKSDALDFGVGYRYHASESNLLHAVKGDAAVAIPEQASPEPQQKRKVESTPSKTKPIRKRVSRRTVDEPVAQGWPF